MGHVGRVYFPSKTSDLARKQEFRGLDKNFEKAKKGSAGELRWRRTAEGGCHQVRKTAGGGWRFSPSSAALLCVLPDRNLFSER